MKKVGLILCTCALFSWTMAKADDKRDFHNQIKGWEWVYQEPCKSAREQYPEPVNFYSYDSHPDYRIIEDETDPYGDNYSRIKSIDRIYDKDGKLVRVSCLLSGHTVGLRRYDDSYISAKMGYYEAQWSILFYNLVRDAIGSVGQCLQSTKDYYFKPLYEHEFRKSLEKSANIKQQPENIIYKGNPFPKELKIKLGNVYTSKKWNDKRKAKFEELIQLAATSSSHTKLHAEYEENASSYMVSASINEEYLKRYTDSICHQGIGNTNYKFSEYGRFKPVIGEVKEKLLNAMMVEDYQSNKYYVKDRETAETLQIIEEKLGLRKVQEDDEIDLIEIICEILRVEYHQGITRNDVAAQLKKKYPYKDDMTIQGMIVEAFTEASSLRLLSLRGEQMEKEKKEKKARIYINQLREDHEGDGEIATIERVDDVTFKISFKSKFIGTRHYALVTFYSEKPYSYQTNIQILKE